MEGNYWFRAFFSGYYSWRTSGGSPFIQSLVHQIRTRNQSEDLLTILTHVNRKVAFEYESKHNEEDFRGKKEMCSIVSTLLRQYYFDHILR